MLPLAWKGCVWYKIALAAPEVQLDLLMSFSRGF
jgi:hypothetical protein